MASTPTFVGGGSDYEESTPWYQNKTLWIVGGLAIAVVVFFYVSSQQSPTGSTSAVTTTPGAGTTTGTTSANLLAAMQQLQTNDQQILQALQSGQTAPTSPTSSPNPPVIQPGVPAQWIITPQMPTTTYMPGTSQTAALNNLAANGMTLNTNIFPTLPSPQPTFGGKLPINTL